MAATSPSTTISRSTWTAWSGSSATSRLGDSGPSPATWSGSCRDRLQCGEQPPEVGVQVGVGGLRGTPWPEGLQRGHRRGDRTQIGGGELDRVPALVVAEPVIVDGQRPGEVGAVISVSGAAGPPRNPAPSE